MKINKSNLAVLTISTALAGCGGGTNGLSVSTSLADLSEVAQIEAEKAKEQDKNTTENATKKAKEIEENA